MPSDQSQRRIFQFLRARLLDQQSFTKDDLRALTTWSQNAFRTYWSKQFQHFMVPLDDGRFRVSESFRPYMTWPQFRLHVTQVRRPSVSSYARQAYAHVRIFEFYMPLTHEHALKSSLDQLFYTDTLIPKLRAIGFPKLEAEIPREMGEAEEAYFSRVCAIVGKHFGGYSISHVNGRFRIRALVTQLQAAHLQIDNQPYLIDETTAVVRFILPCESIEEADLVWFLFEQLFINNILERVNAEAEVWMVEMGMNQRVWIWRVPPAEDDEGAPELEDSGFPDSGDLLS